MRTQYQRCSECGSLRIPGLKGSFTTGQVAAMLGLDTHTVRRWCDNGTLRAWRSPGGHRRIDRESVAALLDA